MKDIMVSVICITYNQELYIAETIESFLMQETNFSIEILIHDDASTDSTAKIIKEYEKKYPEIIKPIFQKNNQYSQGVRVTDIVRQEARGKYLAFCEGDDYWTNPEKLQKQVDFLENNLNYSLSTHAAYEIDAQTNKVLASMRPSETSRTFSTEEIISGGGALFPTNSMVYRKPKNNFFPEFYHEAPVGDYPLTIYLSMQGLVHYMDENMSVYRANVKGSWSQRTLTDNLKSLNHYQRIEIMLQRINEYTNYKYNEVLKNKIKENRFNIVILEGNFAAINEEGLQDIYNRLDFFDKIKLNVRMRIPKIYVYLQSIKKLLNS